MTGPTHAALTGVAASIDPKAGGKFSAFGGMLQGKFLVLVRNKMIVQTWRSVKFKNTDEDSILCIRFERVKGGARLDLVHAFIPGHDYADVKGGWPKYYWKPWVKYIKGEK